MAAPLPAPQTGIPPLLSCQTEARRLRNWGEDMAITIIRPRDNGVVTYARQFTFNPQGFSNRELDGAIVSGMPMAGIPVNNLPNGTLINIPENGSPVLFYKAKSDYESDLNGTGRQLMVRKDCYDNRVWDNGDVNTYASSDLDSWFNSTYKNLLDADIRSLIGTTKIRYTPGNGNWTVGTLERAVFALSATELGQSASWFNVEGSALPIASTLQVAHLNGRTNDQWTRSPHTSNTYYAVFLVSNGSVNSNYCDYSVGSRPCFTLPATAMVDPTPNHDGSYNLIY